MSDAENYKRFGTRGTFDFPGAFWWGWYWLMSAMCLIVAVAMAWMLTSLVESTFTLIVGGVMFNAGALWMLGLEQKQKRRDRQEKGK